MFNKLKRKYKFSRKKRFLILTLVVMAMLLGIGYAYLTSTLEVNGTTMFRKSNWDIHLDNSTIQVESGSVTPITPVSVIGTTLSFSTRLENQGDFYSFTVDVVNAGTINASLTDINITPTLTSLQSEYLTFEVTNSDGTPLVIGETINAGSSKTIKVLARYNTGLDVDKYPIIDEVYDFSVQLDYAQS